MVVVMVIVWLFSFLFVSLTKLKLNQKVNNDSIYNLFNLTF